ncbi:two-component sensor histidine kinase [Streptomyces spiroverticillatus]|uniref:histidine kinase n=1 Tax=Streptomyces finlayi TaxID=67296 RepID=A0A918WX53_9ACTN|nr:sensor histidine kinase [Streptomyces finlayi]GGZ93666.1 two-component sensor histidine kinase [Streptomyces spiroverticillatus]GHC92150.1 two-component sensor histidine kinase [Streptomyces finlayi]
MTRSPRMARPRTWLRSHPLAFDAALAAIVLACMVVGSFADPHDGMHGPSFGTRTPDARGIVLMVLAAGALVYRRRSPLPVLAITSTLTVAALALAPTDPPAPVAMSAVVALYTVAARTDRPTTWRIGLLTMVVLTGAAMLFSDGPWYAQENLGLFAWTGIGASAGDAVRSRRAFIDAIRERAERAERTREEEARRRVAEERLRIARDLHDVVAHHIALVNVQAGVAAHVMDKRPDQAKEALAHVREASRSALNELRATVGLLRQSGDPSAPTEPAPGLAVLDGLLDTFRHAGLPVALARTDDGELAASVDLAAYRIIQEALTNVQKHAGPDAKAEVSVVRVGNEVEVTVLDNGTENPPPADSGGHGLIGMRERVTALGGTLTAGPRHGGGFRVHAILPVTAGTKATGTHATGTTAAATARPPQPGPGEKHA